MGARLSGVWYFWIMLWKVRKFVVVMASIVDVLVCRE